MTYLCPMTISKQKTSLFFRLSISITVFGALFKFISWPLIIMGASGMVIFHSIQFFEKHKRSALDYSRHLLILTFSLNYVFNILQLPYGHVLALLTKLTLIAFLGFYIKKFIVSSQENSENANFLQNFSTDHLSYLLADLATVYIVIASLFKIFNWEFGIINGNLLLIIGLFSALISILAGSKKISS